MLWCEAEGRSAVPNQCQAACNDNENQDEDELTQTMEKLEICTWLAKETKSLAEKGMNKFRNLWTT